jgi:hypothetical protein
MMSLPSFLRAPDTARGDSATSNDAAAYPAKREQHEARPHDCHVTADPGGSHEGIAKAARSLSAV